MNDKYSKIISLLSLGIITLILISACSSNLQVATEITPLATTNPTPTKPPVVIKTTVQTAEPVADIPCTISLWHSFNENQIDSLLSASEAFMEIEPDVEFDFMFSPNFDIRDKFEKAAQSGGGPSILIGTGDWGPAYYDDSLVLNLSPSISPGLLEKLNPEALRSVQYKEALIGLPLNIKGVLMFRNSIIVSDAPQSFSELVNLAQLSTAGDRVGAYLDYGLYYSGGNLEAIGGALMDSEGNPAFNNQKGIEWLEMLKSYKEAGPVEQNNENDLLFFKEGRAGVIIDDYSDATDLATAIGEENFYIDEWPNDMAGYIKTDVMFLNANLTGNDLDCGLQFVEYLLSPDAQEIFADPAKAAFIPAVKGIDLVDPIQNQAAIAFEGGKVLPVMPEMIAYWEPVNLALFSVIELNVDPADALATAEQSIIAQISALNNE